MFAGHDQVIESLLRARAGAPPDRIEAALARRSTTGRALADCAIEAGVLDELELLDCIAREIGGSTRRSLPAVADPAAAGVLGWEMAQRFGVVPVAFRGSTLQVAARDPFRPGLAQDLAFALRRPVELIVAPPAEVERLARTLAGQAAAAVEPGAPGATARADEELLNAVELEHQAGQGEVVRFVGEVLERAIRAKASDVHFEPFEREFKLRLRVDGALQEIQPPPVGLVRPVISRLKVMAQLNITERRRPQDGRIRLTVDGRRVDLRVSTLPTQFGESVVLRVLDASAGRLALHQLGMPDEIRTRLAAAIRRPGGLVVVTGPTGSGKTTSLYACLQELNATDTKILTVEDPVEYEVDGLMQVAVNPAAGLTFARALRSFLRQDPDIVMVGEIRDAESARIAVQAALTGHLVLTTLHTNDAPSAVTRLLDLGVESFLLASTLEAVVAQRLLRRVCSACARPVTVTDAERGLLGPEFGDGDESGARAGAGCAQCAGSGCKGRVGLFEFLPVNETLREQIVRGLPLVAMREQATAEGMISLRRAGLAALRRGETTVEEVLKYT